LADGGKLQLVGKQFELALLDLPDAGGMGEGISWKTLVRVMLESAPRAKSS